VQLLEEEYEILTVADGAAGIEVAAGEQPDLTLMDLSLPGIDGWEATRRLKAKPEIAAIPVIARTAHVMQDDQERARACGCDDYLAKPIDEDQQFARLARFLGPGGPS
jgi:CheY-like chemotaxis protein